MAEAKKTPKKHHHYDTKLPCPGCGEVNESASWNRPAPFVETESLSGAIKLARYCSVSGVSWCWVTLFTFSLFMIRAIYY